MSPSSTLDWVAFAIVAFAVVCLAGYTIAAAITELREGSHAPMRAGSPPRGRVSNARPREPVIDIAEWKLPDVWDTRPEPSLPLIPWATVRSIAPPTKNAAPSLPDDAA